LGLERDRRGAERYLQLEPALGSLGAYSEGGSVQDFVAAQGAEPYLRINRRYASLLVFFRQRIAELGDFAIVEPREFWRVAAREALAETNFDFNPIIDALFDADSLGCGGEDAVFIEQHIQAVEQRIRDEHDPAILAAAAIMLAVSLGYSPSAVTTGCASLPSSSD
jgi:hypothetical protein